jgi:hypothetical protein
LPSKTSLGIIAVALVAILGIGYLGYSTAAPASVTVTRQEYATNLQTATTTVTASSTVTTQATQTATVANSNAYQPNCTPGVACSWPYNYDACSWTGNGNNVVCDGYLIQGQGGCVELGVPTVSAAQPLYNHYTLQNLPSSYPTIGSWVVVSGQLLQGPNSTASGTSCSTSIIIVNSIQPLNPAYP